MGLSAKATNWKVRESLFYDTLAKEVDIKTPQIYYSYGNQNSGARAIIMEDMTVTHVALDAYFSTDL